MQQNQYHFTLCAFFMDTCIYMCTCIVVVYVYMYMYVYINVHVHVGALKDLECI